MSTDSIENIESIGNRERTKGIERLQQLKDKLPEFAKDIKLNIHNLFANIHGSGLTESQFYGTCLAVAYSLKNESIIEAMQGMVVHEMAITKAAQIAATIMAMNNVYYRATHLAEDKELAGMPASLRMNGMINPGVPKVDFELYALAVSAINGCGLCIESHVKQLVQHKVSKLAIQTTLRIAAVLQGLNMALYIENNNG